MKYICKKSSFINHQIWQIKKCLLFRCSSCSRYNANFKFDQSVSAIHDSPPYFLYQWGWPPTETSLVTHARDHWWTLDFANAFRFVYGVNSRAELVPSPRAYARNGAPRRWLGDYVLCKRFVLFHSKSRCSSASCLSWTKMLRSVSPKHAQVRLELRHAHNYVPSFIHNKSSTTPPPPLRRPLNYITWKADSSSKSEAKHGGNWWHSCASFSVPLRARSTKLLYFSLFSE
jgi:hypothetical protein